MLLNCPQKRIALYYTDAEWVILEAISSEMEGVDLRAMMYRKLSKLGKLSDLYGAKILGLNNEEIIKSQREFFIPAGTSCQIIRLSKALGIPVATLVARFVTNPILNQHYQREGISIMP